MSSDDNKDLNLRWIEAFNERDWEDEAACRSREFRAFVSGSPEPLDFEAWGGFLRVFTTAFPDARIAVEEAVSQGDAVATRWRLTGTHRGEFQGVPPSGKTITMPGIEFNRIAGAKIAEHWAQFDLLAVMQQIGALPAAT